MKKVFYLVFLLTIALTSCKEETEENPNKFANEQFYAVMNNAYLWYEHIPTLNPDSYNSPLELLEALRYQPLDRWSYITTKQELNAYYEEGSYIGFGFSSAFDQQGNLWITYIFRESPLNALGIGRGWRITAVNSVQPTTQNINNIFGSATVGISKTIDFIGPSQEIRSHTITKKTIVMNTVLMDSIYTIDNTKVGYLVFKGFINPSIAELDQVFSKFKSEGVNEVIVDLRYNGGGRMDVANHLGGLLAGNIANNQVFTKLVHNNKNRQYDTSDSLKTLPNSITLNRVVFITTEGSASASESLINGLEPYMDVQIVGTKTHGKPVGMYAMTFPEFDWAFVPICFSVTNANDEGDYFDGIAVDYAANDDITYDFGDINESSLNKALELIGLSTSTKKGTSTQLIYHKKHGLAQEINAW